MFLMGTGKQRELGVDGASWAAVIIPRILHTTGFIKREFFLFQSLYGVIVLWYGGVACEPSLRFQTT